MASPFSLSKPQAILLAVNLATESHFEDLHHLIAQHPTLLHHVLVLRILLSCVPETTEPSLYVPFLLQLSQDAPHAQDDGGLHYDDSSVRELSDSEARIRLRSLRLLPLRHPTITTPETDHPLTLFLIHRARRIDAETGLLTVLPQLLTPFLDRSDVLRAWFISSILPLLRLDYEYHPTDGSTTSLAEFEPLDRPSCLRLLLSRTKSRHETGSDDDDLVGRDLRGLVGPWMLGHTHAKQVTSSPASPSHAWTDLYEWLIESASSRFSLVCEVIEQWNGPTDLDLGGYGDTLAQADDDTRQRLQLTYCQSALASIYLSPKATVEVLSGAHDMLARVARLLDVQEPEDLFSESRSLTPASTDFGALQDASEMHLLPNMLLIPSNPLTIPSPQSLAFVDLLILSSLLLTRIGHVTTIRDAAQLCLAADAASQRRELQSLVRSISSGQRRDDEWLSIREQLIWLRTWGTQKPCQGPLAPDSAPHLAPGIFNRVEEAFMEKDIFTILLRNARFRLAAEIYLDRPMEQRTLSAEVMERAILDCVMGFYDNASNGNRTRGAMKKAWDAVNTFYPIYFRESKPLDRAKMLIDATHALSFYSLTLQPRVPFQPVNIRTHPDPVSLLGKVLEQNSRSYTRLDDLLIIGQDLVAAGLVVAKADGGDEQDPSIQRQPSEMVRRRIIGMAIEAALAEDDFPTAYSYALNYLTMPPAMAPDETSWRAAFQAGRHRPSKQSSSSVTRSEDMRIQEMRMELLSRALLLAPPPALSEILGVWRRVEEELNVLLTQEMEEEQEWDDKGDRKIPGQFLSASPVALRKEGGRLGTAEEAPMGLFDVARGAAAALRRSANSLHAPDGTGQATSPTQTSQMSLDRSAAGSDSGSIGGSDEARTRKRDVVSNMVTGGLASGIGWVLGAPPPAQTRPAES
ncbi:MAG: hypothetical protein M1817_004866 [Caeruleum heppii]|nr:MAG: hypothetical protein M1817_004866 [Caeruleum heppii]